MKVDSSAPAARALRVGLRSIYRAAAPLPGSHVLNKPGLVVRSPLDL